MSDKQSPHQILRNAAECAKDRPLTHEEGIAMSNALAEDITIRDRLTSDLIKSMTDDISAGTRFTERTTKALTAIAIYRGLGIEIPS